MGDPVMTARKPRRIRPQVVDLLADHHGTRSDFTRRPWRLAHADGRPFTPAESALANSATPAEVAAAQQLALASVRHLARRQAGLQRLQELLGPALARGMTLEDAVDSLPLAQHDEALALLARHAPEDPPVASER